MSAEDGPLLGEFDVTLVTVPAPQAESLLAAHPELSGAVRRASLYPCWGALVAYDQPLDVALDGAFVEQPGLWPIECSLGAGTAAHPRGRAFPV